MLFHYTYVLFVSLMTLMPDTTDASLSLIVGISAVRADRDVDQGAHADALPRADRVVAAGMRIITASMVPSGRHRSRSA